MNKRDRMNQLRNLIMEHLPVDECHILWNSTQAKRYGGKLPGSHTVGFAMTMSKDLSEPLTVVCPIAKSVAFDERYDHTPDILKLCVTALKGVLTYNMAFELERLETEGVTAV
jgi:hypothetical protein